MQWIFVLCGCMFLLSLIATYQVCTVSLKAGLYTYNCSGADWQKARAFSQQLTASVCAVHAVMLGGESPPSRYSWSRRTREAQGRHREVGSEGRVERMCGARDTNRIRGVVRLGRVGTRPQSPPSTAGAYFIHPASMHRRYDSLPREICGVSSWRTEGGVIPPDHLAEVSRGHSRPGAGEASEAPHGRKAG
jgi:hypothetical protein